MSTTTRKEHAVTFQYWTLRTKGTHEYLYRIDADCVGLTEEEPTGLTYPPYRFNAVTVYNDTEADSVIAEIDLMIADLNCWGAVLPAEDREWNRDDFEWVHLCFEGTCLVTVDGDE